MSERDPKTGRFPKGNGSGWGGGRKGEGHRFVANDPLAGRPEGVKTGEGKAARARAKAQEAAEDAIDTVIAIAKDKADPRALAAAFGILNRVGIHEKSGVEHSGEGGGPLIVERIIIDPQNRDPEGV